MKYDYNEHVVAVLKESKEQYGVVGPLVNLLVSRGWKVGQMIFGKTEWRIPKTPSESTKREKGQSFAGFPVDIAVFDGEIYRGDPNHLLFIVECKQPNEKAGVSQLESYFVGEPHASLGVWVNTPETSAKGAFLYRSPDGRLLLKRLELDKLPRPGDPISPDIQTTTYSDLVEPTEQIFRKVISDLLDKVVISDTVVTRREEQLDQLCNLLLIKLESDKQGKSDPDNPVIFRRMESAKKTWS